MSKHDKGFKADHVAAAKVNGGTGHKKPKKGSSYPDKKVAHSKPRTSKNSRADCTLNYYKTRGLKFNAG